MERNRSSDSPLNAVDGIAVFNHRGSEAHYSPTHDRCFGVFLTVFLEVLASRMRSITPRAAFDLDGDVMRQGDGKIKAPPSFWMESKLALELDIINLKLSAHKIFAFAWRTRYSGFGIELQRLHVTPSRA